MGSARGPAKRLAPTSQSSPSLAPTRKLDATNTRSAKPNACWLGKASPTDWALPTYLPTYTVHDSKKAHKDVLAILAPTQSQDQLAQVVVEGQPCIAHLAS